MAWSRRWKCELLENSEISIFSVRESGDGRLVEQVKGIAQRFNISNSHVYHLFAHRSAIKECVGEVKADSDEADEPNVTPQYLRISKRERRLPISLLTQIKIIEHAERFVSSNLHIFHVARAQYCPAC